MVGFKAGISAYGYSERLVKEAGIMLLPSEMFEYGSSHVRIGFGRANMPEILFVWQKYIDEHPELLEGKIAHLAACCP